MIANDITLHKRSNDTQIRHVTTSKTIEQILIVLQLGFEICIFIYKYNYDNNITFDEKNGLRKYLNREANFLNFNYH